MKDKIYPAILANGVGCTILWFNENKGISLDDGGHVCKESTSKVKNITHEYLANTYGEVVSPEHAEFIVKLGKNANAEISTEYSKGSFFNFYTNSDDELHLDFFDKHLAKDSGEKQITIPLPPKQIQTATPEEEFEMKQIMKNAGDNLVLGYEDSKRDEWPCIDEGVTHPVCGLCKVISPADSRGVVAVISEDGFNVLVFKSDLIKPKTPEEELRDDLINDLSIMQRESNGYTADALLAKYNITKKPQ